jgi:hypothetical protein
MRTITPGVISSTCPRFGFSRTRFRNMSTLSTCQEYNRAAYDAANLEEIGYGR